MATEMTLPSLEENVREVTLVRWLKKVGDRVSRDEPLLEVETDKVTVEVMAEAGGTLTEIVAREGQTVRVGAVLGYLEAAEPDEGNGILAAPARPAVETAGLPRQTRRRLTPVVRRMAQEYGLDLDRLTGTGKGGRISKKDVLAYLAEREPAAGMPGELLALTAKRRKIAERMVHSKQTSPHVTTVFEFDFSAVATHLAAHKADFAREGVKLTYTAYVVSATAQALKQHPLINSSWSDEGILLRRAVNIGLATALDDGLIVPILKGADELNLLGLARKINDLTGRARLGQLQPGEVRDGTFTITNHGVAGSLLGTPIIYQPQGGILGLGLIEKRVKVIHDAIAIRPCAYVSFTFDHRILDGAAADGFVSTIKKIIENW